MVALGNDVHQIASDDCDQSASWVNSANSEAAYLKCPSTVLGSRAFSSASILALLPSRMSDLTLSEQSLSKGQGHGMGKG